MTFKFGINIQKLNSILHMTFMIITVASINFTVFLNVMPCSLVENYWYIRGTNCLISCVTPNMDARHSSETSVNVYQTTQQHNPEENALYIMFMTLTCYPLCEWLVAHMCQWKAKWWKSNRNVGISNGIKLMYYFIPFSPLSHFLSHPNE